MNNNYPYQICQQSINPSFNPYHPLFEQTYTANYYANSPGREFYKAINISPALSNYKLENNQRVPNNNQVCYQQPMGVRGFSPVMQNHPSTVNYEQLQLSVNYGGQRAQEGHPINPATNVSYPDDNFHLSSSGHSRPWPPTNFHQQRISPGMNSPYNHNTEKLKQEIQSLQSRLIEEKDQNELKSKLVQNLKENFQKLEQILEFLYEKVRPLGHGEVTMMYYKCIESGKDTAKSSITLIEDHLFKKPQPMPKYIPDPAQKNYNEESQGQQQKLNLKLYTCPQPLPSEIKDEEAILQNAQNEEDYQESMSEHSSQSQPSVPLQVQSNLVDELTQPQLQFDELNNQETESAESSQDEDSDYEEEKTVQIQQSKKQSLRGKLTVYKNTLGPQRMFQFQKSYKSKSICKQKMYKNCKRQRKFKKPQIFVCPQCDEQYKSGQALGGHMSRVHPGTSNAYNTKIQRRKEREDDRQLLVKAKAKFYELYGHGVPLDRVKIRRFKKELRRQREQQMKEAETHNQTI